jgi:hypothetical protein
MKVNKFILISFGICCLSLSACAVAKSEYGLVKVSENEAIGIEVLVEAMDKSKEPMTCTIKAGKPLMIRFKNHFTIPPSTPIGTDAFIHGVAYWDTVSVKALRHYAEDAGKSMEEINQITQPEFKLNFEGDGIRLVASPTKL